MSKLKHILLISLTWLGVNNSFAQDPAFTQTYANPLYINPAFAGTASTQRICLGERYNWPEIQGPYVANTFSYDRNIIDTNFAVGILANSQNNSGLFSADNIDLVVAKQFHIQSFTLSIGAEFGILQEDVDATKLTFGDEIDPMAGFIYPINETQTRTSVSVPDISVGFLGYGKNYFMGVAVNHLTQPDVSLITGASPLSLKYTVNAGYIIPIGNITLTPTVLYENEQPFNMFMAECYLTKGRFTLGIGDRVSDAVLLALGYRNNWMQVGYSFDYTTSALGISSGGCHELTFAVLFHYHAEGLKKTNGINCPLF